MVADERFFLYVVLPFVGMLSSFATRLPALRKLGFSNHSTEQPLVVALVLDAVHRQLPHLQALELQVMHLVLLQSSTHLLQPLPRQRSLLIHVLLGTPCVSRQ